MKRETNWALHMSRSLSRGYFCLVNQSILVRGRGNPEVMASHWFRKKALAANEVVDWQETLVLYRMRPTLMQIASELRTRAHSIQPFAGSR
jgi:hypothetical protein